MTPPGMVTLDPARGASLTLILAGPPERGGGAGGWASSERAQRRPGRWWQSLPEDTMSLDCILDLTAIRGPSIERRLERLYAMAQPGDADHPPPIRLAGDIWAPDRARRWVIQNATLGERLFTPSGA